MEGHESVLSKLTGHSGCHVYLMRQQKDKYFVRKISHNVKYNNRLRLQCEKQRYFTGFCLHAPIVLSEGLNEDNCYYFDMEYIQGITLAEYIKSVEICEINKIVRLIVDYLHECECSHQNSGILNGQYSENAFLAKIEDLERLLSSENNAVIMAALKKLRRSSWKEFPSTFCHGDLTLENIIIHHEEIYLIDFLDSFYDCYMLDVAALLQDIQYMWSYRFEKNIHIHTKIALMVFRDLLLDEIKKQPDCLEKIYNSLLLKLVRIYPYATDNETKGFLDKNIISLIKLIDGVA
jgi:thiamine kinase-like enzyme